MARLIEWYLAITTLVIGASHILRPGDWMTAYRQLHSAGRPGAFVNGWISLVTGAAIVAGHGSWAWPGAVLTGFGWLLIAKAAVCLIFPDKGLASMSRGASSPRGFVVGGVLLMLIGVWAGYCLWCGESTPRVTQAPSTASPS